MLGWTYAPVAQTSSFLRKTAKSGSFAEIKQAFTQIDGLNLFLKPKRRSRRLQTVSPQKNIWSALRAARKNRPFGRQSQFSSFMVHPTGFEPYGLRLLQADALSSWATGAY